MSLVRKDYNWFAGAGNAMPSDALAVLANSPNPRVRAAVCAQSYVDDETLDLLSWDDDPQVLAAVAEHNGGSQEIQDRLADLVWIGNERMGRPLFVARFRDVAFALAKNHSTSPRILAILAQHDDVLVRQRVAGHPNVSSEALSALAEDNVIEVLLNVARNANTRPATLARLVARRPRSRSLQQAGPLLEVGLVMTREDAIAASRSDFARSYLGDDWSSVLQEVAEHPSTSQADLRILAEEGYGDNVARNPHAPADVLENLARLAQKTPGYDEHDRWRDDDHLLRAIAANPNTPTSTLEGLFEERPTSYVVEAIAGNPSAPPTLLREIARSGDYQSRYVGIAIAENPAAPPEALSALEKYPYYYYYDVREALSYRRYQDKRKYREDD